MNFRKQSKPTSQFQIFLYSKLWIEQKSSREITNYDRTREKDEVERRHRIVSEQPYSISSIRLYDISLLHRLSLCHSVIYPISVVSNLALDIAMRLLNCDSRT